ncbi:High-affinity branched-chain amino acid transport system permease protein LivH [Paraburkholderia rhynchosiae]|uniref:High-affinity branched-chain amino acid transport system permease protein LivH n=3 Tax=Paraburkholderia TaxID=1822464 RepID=A0A6J5CLV2_9BURK|nr:High-affinity branched-chain amino acid transport system permease protein LivH [Paraburkholderia rhynchosiae]
MGAISALISSLKAHAKSHEANGSETSSSCTLSEGMFFLGIRVGVCSSCSQISSCVSFIAVLPQIFAILIAMDILIQQILNGLVLGSVYAIIALGYTMVYGILGIINFAHGDVLMVGAMVALSAIGVLQNHFPGLGNVPTLIIALIIAAIVCAAVGYTIERVAYRPLRKAPRLAPLITAIGVSILLQTLAMMIWSRNPLPFPQLLPTDPINVIKATDTTPGAVISMTEIVIIVVAFLVMGGLLLLVHKTRLGRAMRAIAENPGVASLMGVNPNFVISATFMIGSALAALAGVMIASEYGNAHFYMGFIPGLKAFTAAVLGGIGNLGGAMVGGVILGLIEQLGAGYIGNLTGGVFGSNYQDVFAFIVLIIVLVFRPSGLLGERVADRA